MKSKPKVPVSPISKGDNGEARVQFDLSRAEFLSLLKIVSLGETMANGYRVDDRIQEYIDIEQIILKLAEREGFHEFVEHDPKLGAHFPTATLDEMTSELVVEFEEDSFWEEAADRLAVRDMAREFGERKLKKMPRVRFGLERLKRANEYHSEFENYGIDRLEIVDPQLKPL